MRSLLHLALLALLTLALLGELTDPVLALELLRHAGVLVGLASLVVLAAHGFPAAREAGRALLGATPPDEHDAASLAAVALATGGRVLRDVALGLALLAIAGPLLLLARGALPEPQELAAAISSALVLGVLGLVLGELWLGRAARDLAVHAGRRLPGVGLAPLAFLALPTLILVLIHTKA